MDGTVTSVGSPALAPTAGAATPAAAPADAARHVGTAIGCSTCIGVPLSRDESSSTGSISLPDPEPLRRCRSTSRDDISAASSPRDRPSPLSKTSMHKGESSKAGLKIIKATGDELELQVPYDNALMMPLKAETLMQMSWLNRPSTFMLVKKPNKPRITEALLAIARYLQSARPAASDRLRLIIEPETYAEIAEIGRGQSDADSSSSGSPPRRATPPRPAAPTPRSATSDDGRDGGPDGAGAWALGALPFYTWAEDGRGRAPSAARIAKETLAEQACNLGAISAHILGAYPRRISSAHIHGEHPRRAPQVDLVICLGGDGTLLWASGLFPRAMPPVISFAMGSLGFLSTFRYEQFRERLDDLILKGARRSPRVSSSAPT